MSARRAMMAARFAKQHPQRKPGPGRGNHKTTAHTGSVVLEKRSERPAQSEAATTMNIAPRRVERAVTVLRAAPELAEQAKRCMKPGRVVRFVPRRTVRPAATPIPERLLARLRALDGEQLQIVETRAKQRRDVSRSTGGAQ